MYKKILLPLDGSPLAEKAIPYATALAEKFESEVIIFRVFESLIEKKSLPLDAYTIGMESVRNIGREYLEGVRRDMEKRGVRAQVVTVEGHPQREIVRYAEANEVDLIVLNSRGKSGVSRWLLGSIADRVTRGVEVPVLLVKAD